MHKIYLLVLLTYLARSGSLSAAEVETWKFGNPLLRDDGISVFIPLHLEGSKNTLPKYGIVATGGGGFVSLDARVGQDYKTEFYFRLENTNELRKLVDKYVEWTKHMPPGKDSGTLQTDAQFRGKKAEYEEALKYSNCEYTDGKRKYKVKFERARQIQFGDGPRFSDQMEFSLDMASEKEPIIGPNGIYYRDLLEVKSVSALVHVLASLNQIQVITAGMLDQKRQENGKRLDFLTTFFTSKKGAVLKTNIEQLSRSIEERNKNERAYLVKQENALPKLSVDQALGKITQKQFDRAFNETAAAIFRHEESDTLQRERGKLKTLLEEFKTLLGISYDDAMNEMSELRKPASSK